MRRILFAMIALGALAWMSAPASANPYGGFGGPSYGWNQGCYRPVPRCMPRPPRCGNLYGNYGGNFGGNYGGNFSGGGFGGGNRWGNRGGSFGGRY